ncbi:hypothetical protein GC163_11510 [bacterium]|nr:hypothetical protein [bacterium]
MQQSASCRENAVGPVANPLPSHGQPAAGWRSALWLLAFWCSLLTSAVGYGVVALSPKLITWCQLQQQYQSQQLRLLQLEQQTDQLRQVVDALDHDPAFVAELTRWELAVAEPGEEIIPVETALTLQTDSSAPLVTTVTNFLPAAWLPWLEAVATRDPLRWFILFSAAVLVVTAFTWFQEPSPPDFDPVQTASATSARWWQRYRRVTEE